MSFLTYTRAVVNSSKKWMRGPDAVDEEKPTMVGPRWTCQLEHAGTANVNSPGLSRAPYFHQLPKRLCAFARVAVRWAVAWAACAAARPAPAGSRSRPRAGALAGRPGRGPLVGLGAAPWEISNTVV